MRIRVLALLIAAILLTHSTGIPQQDEVGSPLQPPKPVTGEDEGETRHLEPVEPVKLPWKQEIVTTEFSKSYREAANFFRLNLT